MAGVGWLPMVVTGVTSLGNLVKTGITKTSEISNSMDVVYTQNFREKELATRMVQMYTTNAKDVKGGIIPETPKNTSDRSKQIDELMHSLLNQTRGINIK